MTYPMATTAEGATRVNPSDAFNAEVAMTSAMIEIAR